MGFNIVVGLAIPWLVGAWLYLKDRDSVLLIAPFASVLAWTVNQFGFHYGFWEMSPFGSQECSAWPFNLGLFPLSFCFTVYAARHTRYHPALLIVASSLFLTLLEFLGVVSGHRGWNTQWTFISYLVPNLLCFAYYRLLHRQGITE
ncbi:MAG: hypothetical protein ACM3ZQ_04405 [Bacillota bacterium]